MMRVNNISICFLSSGGIVISKGDMGEDDPKLVLTNHEFIELANKIDRLREIANELD